MATVASITDSNFQSEVLEQDVPVLVDFWAPWCGPCRLVAPIVDEVAAEFAGQLKVVKVNVDNHPEIAQQYGIRSIPTLILFKHSQPFDRVVGAVAKPTLVNLVTKSL